MKKLTLMNNKFVKDSKKIIFFWICHNRKKKCIEIPDISKKYFGISDISKKKILWNSWH
jgi:hypothetical protein